MHQPILALVRSARRVVVLLAIVTLESSLVGIPALGVEPSGIPWRADFESAEAEARQTGRPLWVQFGGPWCPFCRQMDQETLTRPEIAATAARDFVPVRVRSDIREDLSARFGVTALPATVIVGPDGQALKTEGFNEAGPFLAFLDSARPQTLPPADPPPALGGYCPVSLVEGRGLVAGREDLTARHDGRLYRFASPEDRSTFLADPERFLPSGGGHCVVSQIERGETLPGDPRFGVYYRDRLFLCADEAARASFARDPERYSAADVANLGNCPHCTALDGREVRGESRYSVTHAGRRYLFPNGRHMEAFRAEPDKYLR